MNNIKVSSPIISVIFLISIATSIVCRAEEANDTIRVGENSYVISSGKATLVGVNPENTVQDLPDQISYIVDGEERTAKVTCIKKGLFTNSNLRQIRLPQYLTTIEEYAFYNTRLTYIYFPKTITDIGSYAFAECKELRATEFDPNMEMVYFQSEHSFSNCTSLQYLNLPNNLELMHGIIIESYETSHGTTYYQTFCNIWDGCSSVKTIATGTGAICFYMDLSSLTKLEKIFFNKKIKSISSLHISNYAECPSLTDIYCINPEPPSYFETGMFKDDVYDRVTLHVPYFFSDDYLADKEWSKFKKIVEFGPSDLPDFSSADIVNDIKEEMPCHIANGWLRIDEDATEPVDVYTINGLNILTLSPGTEQQLPSGIYIIRYKTSSKKIKI